MEATTPGIKCIIKTTRIMPTLEEEALLVPIAGDKEAREDKEDKDGTQPISGHSPARMLGEITITTGAVEDRRALGEIHGALQEAEEWWLVTMLLTQ